MSNVCYKNIYSLYIYILQTFRRNHAYKNKLKIDNINKMQISLKPSDKYDSKKTLNNQKETNNNMLF